MAPSVVTHKAAGVSALAHDILQLIYGVIAIAAISRPVGHSPGTKTPGREIMPKATTW
jgi:hypothetical protein